LNAQVADTGARGCGPRWGGLSQKAAEHPLAWLANVLGRIAEIPQSRLAELLPWNWKHSNLRVAA